MTISFSGFDKKTATFKATGVMDNGAPVKILENGMVSFAGTGNPFCGILDDYDGKYAGVQLRGVVTSKYTDAAPALGYTKLVTSGVGVKCDEAGREYLVLAVDETASTVTFLM